MPANLPDSFSVELFDEWKAGEDTLSQPCSNQITLRCLGVFDTTFKAMDSYASNRKAWSKKLHFTLQDLNNLDETKVFIVTPCELRLIDKAELESMLPDSSIWFFFVKALKKMNEANLIVGNTKLRLPKECFITGVISLEAKIGKRYLLQEQKYQIRSNGSSRLKKLDKWYDVDLGRAKP